MTDRIMSTKQPIDADALLPRDANVQLPHRVVENAKNKAPATKALQKEKELPPQPPSIIPEPPSFDRKNGATYQVGKMLGKGGFAVCYEGYLTRDDGSKRKYALKIVRSKMPPKMEQKVSPATPPDKVHSELILTTWAVPN